VLRQVVQVAADELRPASPIAGRVPGPGQSRGRPGPRPSRGRPAGPVKAYPGRNGTANAAPSCPLSRPATRFRAG
jgi:hypothetical protein